MAKRTIRITDRDLIVLKHTRDFGMTWLEPLNSTIFAGREMDAVRSTLRRLTGKRPNYFLLKPVGLANRRICYQLTRRGCAFLGAPQSFAKPLGRRAKARRYALQWYVCVEAAGRRRLCHPRDLPQVMNVKRDVLGEMNSFLEQDACGRTRFGVCIVDYATDVRRLVRRIGNVVERFLTRHWFDGVIQSGSFRLVILTVTEGKKAAIETRLLKKLQARLGRLLEAVTPESSEQAFVVEVCVVEGLIDVIGTVVDD